MVAKIKFSLKMRDGAQVRNIDELREHFDIATVLGYYDNGKLGEWLSDRYYEEEAEKVNALNSSSPNFKRSLCDILGVPYSDTEAETVDLAIITARNERRERLKQFTADDNILAAVDSVAFSQEDLADLLDENAKLIYLCGERFRIPCSKGGVTNIGINNPVVDVAIGYDKKGIIFTGVQGASIKSVFTSDLNFFGDLPNDMVKKAAENGNIHAQLELARRYDVSKDSPSILNNPEQARYWYKKVRAQWEENAKNGDLAAQDALGTSYLFGNNGVKKNIDKSRNWSKSVFDGYKKLAEKGEAAAQCSLGIIFVCGQEDTEPDLKKAIYWFELSAKQGNLEAMGELVEIYGNDGDEAYDKDKLKYWKKEYDAAEFIRCKKAAEQGDASEQSRLGDYYADGKGTDANADKADFWYKLAFTGFKKAAEQGDARAQMQVARCYHDGKGAKIDKQAAFMWYKKAAEQE